MKGFMPYSPDPLSTTCIHRTHAITIVYPRFNSEKDLHSLSVGIDICKIGFIGMSKPRRPTQRSITIEHTGAEQNLILSIAIHITTHHVMRTLTSHNRVLFVTIPSP